MKQAGAAVLFRVPKINLKKINHVSPLNVVNGQIKGNYQVIGVALC